MTRELEVGGVAKPIEGSQCQVNGYDKGSVRGGRCVAHGGDIYTVYLYMIS